MIPNRTKAHRATNGGKRNVMIQSPKRIARQKADGTATTVHQRADGAMIARRDRNHARSSESQSLTRVLLARRDVVRTRVVTSLLLDHVNHVVVMT